MFEIRINRAVMKDLNFELLATEINRDLAPLTNPPARLAHRRPALSQSPLESLLASALAGGGALPDAIDALSK